MFLAIALKLNLDNFCAITLTVVPAALRAIAGKSPRLLSQCRVINSNRYLIILVESSYSVRNIQEYYIGLKQSTMREMLNSNPALFNNIPSRVKLGERLVSLFGANEDSADVKKF